MKKYFFIVWVLLVGAVGAVYGQDSIPHRDTAKRSRTPLSVRRPAVSSAKPAIPPDSTSARAGARRDTQAIVKNDSLSVSARDSVPDTLIVPAVTPPVSYQRWQPDSFYYSKHPFFSFTDPVHLKIIPRKWQGKEAIFYSIIALLIFFALIKNGFHRYVQDLFNVFFRTTMRQKQIKDQLIQSPFPSMLMNIFFILSISMFLTLLLQYFRLGLQFNFWILFAYCVLGLTAIYSIKFLSLKFFGWIFQVSDATDSYIFIVFTTNKVIGILLLPFVVTLAFTYGLISQVALILSLIVIFGLLAYRFFLSYISIQRQMQISVFHFLLYLLACEIIPVLLINKLLFTFLSETS